MDLPKTPVIPKDSEAWKQFKFECANEIGHIQFVKENNDHYKGNVPAKQNGAEGGPIGGRMVQKVFQMVENQNP